MSVSSVLVKNVCLCELLLYKSTVLVVVSFCLGGGGSSIVEIVNHVAFLKIMVLTYLVI